MCVASPLTNPSWQLHDHLCVRVRFGKGLCEGLLLESSLNPIADSFCTPSTLGPMEVEMGLVMFSRCLASVSTSV